MAEFLGLHPQASLHAGQIDQIIVWMHYLMFVLFIGWGSFFVYTLFRFRQSKSTKADYHGVKSHLSTYIEVAVAIFEVVLLVGFSIPFWSEAVASLPPEKESLVVRVVAEQFAWNYHYAGPDGKFGKVDLKHMDRTSNPLGIDPQDENGKDDVTTINQLMLPKDKKVILKISSKDVIHSFGAPHMRVKQDAIPGMEVPIWFVPTVTTQEMRTKLNQECLADAKNDTDKLGCECRYTETPDKNRCKDDQGNAIPQFEYEVACSQLCGIGHSKMWSALNVLPQSEFDQWLQKQVEAKASAGDTW